MPGTAASILKYISAGDLDSIENLAISCPKVIPMLQKQFNTIGCGALHIAAANNHLDLIKYFIFNVKVDVNLKTSYGWSALMVACYHRHFAVASHLAGLVGNIGINDFNLFGMTALHMAVARNDIDIVKLLIRCGANPNIRAPDGFTCLMLACQRSSLEMVRILLDKGAEANAQNSSNNWAALMYVALRQDYGSSTNMARFLIKYGADIHVKNNQGKTCIDLAKGCKNLTFLNALESLHESIIFESESTLPKPNFSKIICNQDVTNPIFVSILNRNIPLLLRILSEPKRYLEEVHQESGHSPLTLASLKGDRTIVKILLEYGASVDVPNLISKWTPLMYTVTANEIEVAKLLLEHGASQDVEVTVFDEFNELAAIMTVRDVAFINGTKEMTNLLDYYREKKQEKSKLHYSMKLLNFYKGFWKRLFSRRRLGTGITSKLIGNQDKNINNRPHQNCMIEYEPSLRQVTIQSSSEYDNYLAFYRTGSFASINEHETSSRSFVISHSTSLCIRNAGELSLNSLWTNGSETNLKDSAIKINEDSSYSGCCTSTRIRPAKSPNRDSVWEKNGAIPVPTSTIDLVRVAFGEQAETVSKLYAKLSQQPLEVLLSICHEYQLKELEIHNDKDRAKLFVTIIKIRGQLIKEKLMCC